MKTVTLGKGGPKVSEIGVGMWQAGGPSWGDDVSDEACLAGMKRAHALGVTLFDTAEGYGAGHSEEVVGRGIREIGRDELVIATKVAGTHARGAYVERACDASLKRLGIHEIDVYQIHWPDPWDQASLKETMKAMERLHRAGKIRHVAVSNFAVRDLEEARAALSRTDIIEDQVHWSLLHRNVEDEVVPYCTKEGIAILPWSPLEKGLLAGKYDAKHKPADEVRKGSKMLKDENLAEIAKFVAVLKDVGAKHGRTPTQVALNWLMRQPGTVVPIPGIKTAAQAEDNAGAAGWSLTSAEVRRISDASHALTLDLF
ncbi:MAG TPA: aldo/keto reductase [Thermoplasmata archaeon]|nr:aldo/keto reductase [Thermoplasmata archaeon]